MPSVVAIRHVAFEDLGAFAPVLASEGYKVRYHDIGVDSLRDLDPLKPDLLIVLGAPIGAYDETEYPFLRLLLDLLASRLAAGQPTLGICLGAQLIARALGAKVYPGPVKEIGWAPLGLSAAGRQGPLRHLDGVPVLHWHGDTFDLPSNAVRLAETTPYPNQAFALGASVLALQFHLEVEASGFERWLIGHAAEIAGAGISPSALRQQAERHAAASAAAGRACLRAFLSGLSGQGGAPSPPSPFAIPASRRV